MSTADQPAPDGTQVTPAAGDPAPAAGVQPADGAAPPERIPLPAPQAPPVNPEALIRRARGLDAVLVGVVLIFAFVTASFRAANSDLFLHLATGRLIVQGAFEFGKDPFTFGSEGVWVEHSWLFDVIVYGLYNLPNYGPQALVVAKALLIAGLAWFMFRAGSLPGRRAWISAACALLGVLALSPRVLMQPIVVSYFLLGLTLYLLFTGSPRDKGSTSTESISRRLWALPVVCLAWVNLDAWFLLGPLTILLYLLGEVIDPLLAPPAEGQPAPDRSHLRTLGLVLAASLVACLLNPYHVRAFTLPGMLTEAGTPLADEPQFRSYFLSPFIHYKAYLQENIGLSVAGMAFPVLLLGSLASFGLLGVYAADRLRAGRALIWLATGMLAAHNLRLIPFFAVAAAPIMALNYLDLAEKLFGAQPRTETGWRRWAMLGRVLTILAGIGLVLGSIGGYVQAQPYHARQVGWGVEVDEGLKGAALQVAEWREQEALPREAHWFNLGPEVVSYFAWFCPGEKTFLDQRVGLYRAAGKDFAAVRKALDGVDVQRDDMSPDREPGWRDAFRRRQAQFIVLQLYDLNRQGVMLQMVYGNPEEFVPCFVKGKTAVFAWRDPRPRPGTAPPALDARLPRDFAREAFGAEAVPLPDGLVSVTPEESWWRPLLVPPGAASPSGWQAVQHFTRFEAMTGQYREQNQAAWVATMGTSLVGLGGQRGGPMWPGTLATVAMYRAYGQVYGSPLIRVNPKTGKPEGKDPFFIFYDAGFRLLQAHMQFQDAGPVDALYLAVRQARRGLSESRDDARTSLVLAEAYSRLAMRTRERTRIGRTVPDEKGAPRFVTFFPHVEHIRQAQVAAALNEVFKQSPPARIKQVAHLLLLEVYQSPKYLELQVKHFREYVNLCRALKYVPTVSPEKMQEELDRIADMLKQLEQVLKTKQEQYILKSAGKKVLEQARAAKENGLPETALKLLIEAKTDDLMAPNSGGVSEGAYMAVDLFLAVGRVHEASEVLIPEAGKEKEFNKSRFGVNELGLPAYEWFRVVLGAATGDYKSADEFLAECLKQVETVPGGSAALQGMQVLPMRVSLKNERPLSLGELAAYTVANALLYEAPTAAGLPWQWGRFAPIRQTVPQAGDLPVRNWRSAMGLSMEVVNNLMSQQANLLTLRAWLALEQGHTEKARQLARQALALSARGRVEGYAIFAPYPSRDLALLVVDLAERRGKRR